MLEKFYIATEKFWMISDVFYDGKETLEENLKFLQKIFGTRLCLCAAADDTIKWKSS